MFPPMASEANMFGCFPRARGDVPIPHTRSKTFCLVFPAHAGMFRQSCINPEASQRFPRARGDVPGDSHVYHRHPQFSPRTRGCSRLETLRVLLANVFPAHAGMFLEVRKNDVRLIGFPRARGDVPVRLPDAGVGGPFSPRTRGCSWLDSFGEERTAVFPAHAGMFPTGVDRGKRRVGFPRARGDVPFKSGLTAFSMRFSPRTRGCSYQPTGGPHHDQVFPAHAGMFLPKVNKIVTPHSFPRARGDVPYTPPQTQVKSKFSPRTRGCSQMFEPFVKGWEVFPAHAGMFRGGWSGVWWCAGFPRARGDVPPLIASRAACELFSPRTRGCSPFAEWVMQSPKVFPAHAGMFRRTPATGLPDPSFPRARGDVPSSCCLISSQDLFSPRTRGCS